MKDFQLRNDTKLLFRNDPSFDLKSYTANKNVLFVYGSHSAKTNGCYDDVKNAVVSSHGMLMELENASREVADIERGIQVVKDNQIDLIIGAGGASVMDCAKLIAFGTYHKEDLWSYLKGEKNPYGLKKLPLILIPTYPSSGSEYGLGAVANDSRCGEYGTAYGIAADIALLVPKYSMALNKEMTAYSGLVTFVQLSASTIGDKNPVSYDIGISVLKNVLSATTILKENPENEDARGTILYGASISTSGRLGLGKEENYAYDIYELEFIPEVLYQASYRESLVTIFPRFLKAMSKYHEDDIAKYLKDVFGYEENIEDSISKMISLFESFGINMYFDKDTTKKEIEKLAISSTLSLDEITTIMHECK